MLALLAGSVEDGLNPDDYHYSDVMALWEMRDQLAEQRDRARARFDLLLTDGIVLYVRHLLEGKVNPKLLDSTFNYSRRDVDPQRVANNLRTLIAEDRIAEIARSLFLKFSANHQYVIDNDLILYDHNGRPVDPHKIKCSQFSGQSFPYRVVQQPGLKNALG